MHVKYYNSKGEEVPSVTTVIKIYNKDLDGWANYIGRKGIKLDEYLEEKAQLGTYIHKLAEQYFSPDLTMDIHPDREYLSVSDFNQLKNRLDYLKNILAVRGYQIYKTEMEIHGETYGGTLDLLFYNSNIKQFLLLDLKTSKSLRHTMYYQLMGYCQLLKEKFDIEVSEVGIILITKDDEDPDFLRIYNTNDNYCINCLTIFNSLLKIYTIISKGIKKETFICE